CPFMGASQKLDSAIGMAAATTFVLTLACAISYLLEHYLLQPLGLEYLRIIAFIVTIAALVQFSELVIRATQPVLHQVLGLFIPLITTNCAVLGVALLNVRQNHSLFESIFYGLGAAVGFSLMLIVFAALRERQTGADIPAPFQGAAINMITAGLLSLAFMGFTGMGA
ncbi:MAG: electron transport complex protein RnfA, partial [Candidatus Azotimanducaceae bacterium]